MNECIETDIVKELIVDSEASLYHTIYENAEFYTAKVKEVTGPIRKVFYDEAARSIPETIYERKVYRDGSSTVVRIN